MNRELLDYVPPTDDRELNPCRVGGGRLLFKGGSSSSAATSSSSQPTDKRVVADNQAQVASIDRSTVAGNAPAIVISGNSGKNASSSTVIQMVDSQTVAAGRAIAADAFDLTRTSNENSLKSISAALGFADQTMKGAMDLANASLSAAETSRSAVIEQADGTQALVKTGLVVAGIVAAGFAFGKR